MLLSHHVTMNSSKDQGETGTATENNTEQRRSLLSVEYKYLDAEAEMKRMFGSRVVNSESRVHPSGRYGREQERAKSFLTHRMSMQKFEEAEAGQPKGRLVSL